MAKAKAKATKSGSGESGPGHGGSGVTAAPLPPLFVSGRKIRDGEYAIVVKRGEGGEAQAEKIVIATVEERIKNGQGNAEELQWLLDQCADLPEEAPDA